jgi:ankyrin repeat protein
MRQLILVSALCVSLTLATSGPAAAAPSPAAEELYGAVMLQDQKDVERLLKGKPDLSYKERGTPLIVLAVRASTPEIVHLLLGAGANPNDAVEGTGITALMAAVEMGSMPVITDLLASKANPSATTKDGRSCIMLAVSRGNTEVVEALINAKADLNYVPAEGEPIVLYAVQQESSSHRVEVVQLLGKGGANLNAGTLNLTPLGFAVQIGNTELVEALLDAGADPNAKNGLGQAPIHRVGDNVEVLEILLKAKADPNLPMEGGVTPLIDAVNNNRVDVVKILLAAGADPTRTDEAGRTALAVAERNSQSELITLLKQPA